MALDFPLIGESRLALNLDPQNSANKIQEAQLLQLLYDKIHSRNDRAELIKAIQEFFSFSADFMRAVSNGKFPEDFNPSVSNEHFVLWRETPKYKFEVDSYAANRAFFERTQFKLFLKSKSFSESVMTLFLVPSNCER